MDSNNLEPNTIQIETGIKEIIVTIDGRDYPVAGKTVKIAEELQETEKSLTDFPLTPHPQYELWLAELRIVLGVNAVDSLFPNGQEENLDRMEAIYNGVMDAFDGNAQRCERADASKRRARKIRGNQG